MNHNTHCTRIKVPWTIKELRRVTITLKFQPMIWENGDLTNRIENDRDRTTNHDAKMEMMVGNLGNLTDNRRLAKRRRS